MQLRITNINLRHISISMKKLFFVLSVLGLYSLSGSAQLSAVDYKSEQFAQFKSSKTYVVKTGNAAFDTELENAMKALWKITSYDVIDSKAFETKITDKSASFILSVIIGTQNAGQNYHYLALVNGGVKKVSKYSYDDMIAYAVINHFQNEPENTDCAYRVRNMIESMIDAINIVQKNDIHGNSKKIALSLLEFYRTKSPKIKERVLLIPDYILNKKLDKADIAGLYPFKYEVCSKDKIAQAIKDKSKEYYYFQPAITLNKSIFVFDPFNGEVLYGDAQVMGLTIKESDFENLVNAIKGKK